MIREKMAMGHQKPPRHQACRIPTLRQQPHPSTIRVEHCKVLHKQTQHLRQLLLHHLPHRLDQQPPAPAAMPLWTSSSTQAIRSPVTPRAIWMCSARLPATALPNIRSTRPRISRTAAPKPRCGSYSMPAYLQGRRRISHSTRPVVTTAPIIGLLCHVTCGVVACRRRVSISWSMLIVSRMIATLNSIRLCLQESGHSIGISSVFR